eukprot:Skav216219  [mRNA]  locus=scaffold238:344528:348960:+ [translate_table: standard]
MHRPSALQPFLDLWPGKTYEHRSDSNVMAPVDGKVSLSLCQMLESEKKAAAAALKAGTDDEDCRRAAGAYVLIACRTGTIRAVELEPCGAGSLYGFSSDVEHTTPPKKSFQPYHAQSVPKSEDLEAVAFSRQNSGDVGDAGCPGDAEGLW